MWNSEQAQSDIYGEVKIILMNSQNMNMIHQKVNKWCSVMNNITSPFLFEEPTVTDEKLIAMMKDNDLHHIRAGTVF